MKARKLGTFASGDFAIFTPNSKKVEFSKKWGQDQIFIQQKAKGHISLGRFA